MRFTPFILCTIFSFFVEAQISQNVTLKYHWKDDSLVGSAQYNNTYNEIWGYAQNGREYAIIGSTAGTHFFDVTDPVNTQELFFVPGKHTNHSDIVHRDYHDYRGYLYAVADEGFSSLQIIDLRQLPDTVFVVYDSSDKIKNAHNIFIDTATAKLYACNVRTGEPRFAGFQAYSLGNPIDPQLVYESKEFGVHDMFARNDTVFLNSGSNGLIIYNFSNASNPQLLGTVTTYTDQGYNHSGWLDASGEYYYLADETHGMRMKAFDCNALSDLEEVAAFGIDEDTNSIAHNLIWRDHYLFVSYYYDGLQIFDVSNPSNPVRVGYYDTYEGGDYTSYKGAWGVYPLLPSGTILVSDMQSGLYVFSAPNFIGIEEQSSELVQVFPNPFHQKIQINIPSNLRSKNASINIYNSQGVLVYQERKVSEEKDMILSLNLSSGLYLLEFVTENQKYHQKLIKY